MSTHNICFYDVVGTHWDLFSEAILQRFYGELMKIIFELSLNSKYPSYLFH